MYFFTENKKVSYCISPDLLFMFRRKFLTRINSVSKPFTNEFGVRSIEIFFDGNVGSTVISMKDFKKLFQRRKFVKRYIDIEMCFMCRRRNCICMMANKQSHIYYHCLLFLNPTLLFKKDVEINPFLWKNV